jgi:hypothetical protein
VVAAIKAAAASSCRFLASSTSSYKCKPQN